MSSISTLLLGRRLCDRYHVRSVIGAGGMGVVCRARDERLGRDVAVKVLSLALEDPDEQAVLRARFQREARAVAALRHPNVVTVYDFGTDPELQVDLIVMEFLPGRDVAERLREAGGALPLDEALEVLRGAARGVAAGHRAGLLHRDVKPRNLFLVADPAGAREVKVLDFGIAQLPDAEGRLTRAVSPHTPRYAAPEQIAGEPLTPACDVYALGLTALEMLTGRYPEGVNTAEDDALAARWTQELRTAHPALPAAVAAVLLKSLLRDPGRRFADAGRLLAALDHALGARAAAAESASPAAAAPPGPAVLPEDATVALPAPRAGAPPAPTAGTPPAALPFAAPEPSPPAGPVAAPAPAAAEGAAGEPRRRPRLAVGVAGVLVAAAAVVGLQVALGGAREEGDAGPPVVVERGPWRDEAAMRQVAAAERARARRAGVAEGDGAWFVVLASFEEHEAGAAAAARERLAARGYAAGLANSLVYPELRDGYLALLAGPYPARTEAEEELPALRREVARDAFLRRVTVKAP